MSYHLYTYSISPIILNMKVRTCGEAHLMFLNRSCLEAHKLHPWKPTAGKSPNDGLEKVAPFKYGHFWYQFVKFLGGNRPKAWPILEKPMVGPPESMILSATAVKPVKLPSLKLTASKFAPESWWFGILSPVLGRPNFRGELLALVSVVTLVLPTMEVEKRWKTAPLQTKLIQSPNFPLLGLWEEKYSCTWFFPTQLFRDYYVKEL